MPFSAAAVGGVTLTVPPVAAHSLTVLSRVIQMEEKALRFLRRGGGAGESLGIISSAQHGTGRLSEADCSTPPPHPPPFTFKVEGQTNKGPKAEISPHFSSGENVSVKMQTCTDRSPPL